MRLSGINPGFPGLSRCRGQITHVLLTRSPLSPGPKPRFSLDLHVLSAPPAFVLSQDQTLRERAVAGSEADRLSHLPRREMSFTLSLCSKVTFRRTRQGLVPRWDREANPSRSRRKRTLLSFQRPCCPSANPADQSA